MRCVARITDQFGLKDIRLINTVTINIKLSHTGSIISSFIQKFHLVQNNMVSTPIGYTKINNNTVTIVFVSSEVLCAVLTVV
jgi:hypothetical protein